MKQMNQAATMKATQRPLALAASVTNPMSKKLASTRFSRMFLLRPINMRMYAKMTKSASPMYPDR